MILPCSCKPQRVMTLEIYHCHLKIFPHLCVESAILGFTVGVTKAEFLLYRNSYTEIQTNTLRRSWIRSELPFVNYHHSFLHTSKNLHIDSTLLS